MPSLNRGRKPLSLGLRSTTYRGDTPMHAGPVGGPSRLVGALSVVRVEPQMLSLSLSWWRKVLFTFGGVVGILAKF